MNELQTVRYIYDLKTNFFNLKDKRKIKFFFYITHIILII